MAARPFPAVPFIINSQTSPIPVTDLDTDFAQLLTDFNDSAIGYVNYAADIGTANAYVLNLASAPSAYVAGMTVAFFPANSNGTGASTINVNSLGGVNLTDCNAGTPAPGMIKANEAIVAIYDGTQFRIVTLTDVASDLGNMVNPTFNCAGYKKVWLMGNMNGQNNTLTLTNLNYGCDIQIYIRVASTFTLKLAATTPGSVAYTITGYAPAVGTSGTFSFNMVTGGYSQQSTGQILMRGVTGQQAATAFLPLMIMG